MVGSPGKSFLNGVDGLTLKSVLVVLTNFFRVYLFSLILRLVKTCVESSCIQMAHSSVKKQFMNSAGSTSILSCCSFSVSEIWFLSTS